MIIKLFFKRFIFLLLIPVLVYSSEVINPDFDGNLSPEGWIPRKAVKRVKLGLAFSGGGLRGLAHTGVLQALEENHIPVDYIAGVSMGSIVGAMYASGYSVQALQISMSKTDWGELFIDQPSRRSLFLNRKRTYGRHLFQIRFKGGKPYVPSGFSSGQKIGLYLDELLMNGIYRPHPDFDHLKVPFRAPATDLFTGELVIFDDGDLSEVLRASMAFPLVFAPVKVRGKTLIDGGALENIPVSTVRKMGADRIIAVDTSSPLLPDVDEPWEIANQVTTIMIAEGMDEALNSADLVLKPVPDSIGAFDFDYIGSIAEMGRQTAEKSMDSIKEMLSGDKSSQDTRNIYFKELRYLFSNVPGQDTSEVSVLNVTDSVSVQELKTSMAKLYELYELDDIYAEAEHDTLTIVMKPAPSFRRMVIRGNSVIPDSLIMLAIKSPPGLPVSRKLAIRDQERIISLYREQGYALAAITHTEVKDGILYITIDEGKIASLKVEGGRSSALNELRLNPGELFNWNTAKKGLNRIYGSDIYETVRLKTRKVKRGHEITLALDRRTFPLIRLGARFDRERKGSGFAEFIHEDLLASGTAVNILAALGEKDTRASAGLSADKILRTYLSFNAGLYYNKNEHPFFDLQHKRMPGYEYERAGAVFGLGQHLFRWGMLSATLKMERAFSDHPDDEPEQKLASLTLESEIDTYDRYPFPDSGEKIRLSFQTSGEPVPGDAKYSKFEGDIQRWFQIRNRWSAYLRLRGGYAEPTVPTFEKFSLGGLHDFGGLHDREVLGNQMFGGSYGLRYDLLSRFLAEAFVTARYDFAQIVDGTDVLEFKQGFFRQGFSLSFALNTLLGPVELAWGWAAPYKDIPQNHLLYFSIGHEF